MKFESPARIALPLGLVLNTTIKTPPARSSQWEARIALFNGDHFVRICNGPEPTGGFTIAKLDVSGQEMAICRRGRTENHSGRLATKSRALILKELGPQLEKRFYDTVEDDAGDSPEKCAITRKLIILHRRLSKLREQFSLEQRRRT
jgi:hypothetical protein